MNFGSIIKLLRHALRRFPLIYAAFALSIFSVFVELAAMASLRLRVRVAREVETEAHFDGVHPSPNASLLVWLEPGEAAVDGPLPIIPPGGGPGELSDG